MTLFMQQPFLIDTDMAFDDWMAILYLLQSPMVDVKVITIAATGEAYARPAIYHARQLVSLCQREPLPVAAGRRHPLRGHQRFPWFVRLAMSMRLGIRLPRPRPGAGVHLHTLLQQAPTTAVALMAQQLEAANQPVTIVALGPLTNLAELITLYPQWLPKIKMIYAMGGALHVPGNIAEINQRIDNPYAEWNIFIDPHAAAIVFDSGLPITLVPLDVTNQAPISLDFYARTMQHDAPAAEFMHLLLRRLLYLIQRNRAYFWDPTAAVIATDNSLASFVYEGIRVELEPGNQLGRTVVVEQGAPIRVCAAIDQTAFEDLLWQTLSHNERLQGEDAS